ncbi:hypothetical protein J5N97_002374 [Dioscorea zingiberensis]|uniref:Cyclin-like domain-containing protein n=1 Tax=Dioscorea zingiberensis TaxID=325984 RepID=A0A9D5HPE4_9LILI|nr:hypothetical protein J5N97_002374 [Dioscorea zingiberensis]
MEGSSPLLLCDEELMLSSPSHSSPLSLGCYMNCCSSSTVSGGDHISEEDMKIVFQEYMRREHVYQPYVQYVEQLQSSSELSIARFRAVRWIILACSRLKLSLGTTFNSVNYLDRFISMNCSLEWETWMMELLSIACISIASKLDEVIIPSVHDFLEEVEHTFKPSTIQRMELSVLKALNWRLTSVTAYSYVDLLMRRPRANRVTELLLHALLGFSSSSHATWPHQRSSAASELQRTISCFHSLRNVEII